MFVNCLICFRKFDWKATHVTLFWNLARNPGKNTSKILRKMQNSTKKIQEIEKIGNSIIQSRKNVWRFLTKKLRLENGPSLFSRFSLQPPFAEVLSSVLRAAQWPLVFTFSGLFWARSVLFSPVFDYGFQKRCKGVHYVDLGETFPTHIYLQHFSSIQPRTSPSKLDS